MKKILQLSLILMLFTACSTTHNGILHPSSVYFNNPNFTYIKSIDGFSKTTYVFGLGGKKKDGLIKEAKLNMYENHKFKKGQTITNIAIDKKQTWIFIPIVYQITVNISGDIYEFHEGTDNSKTD